MKKKQKATTLKFRNHEANKLKIINCSPRCFGSVVRVLACGLKGPRFNSWSRAHAQVAGLVSSGGMQEAAN